MLRNNIVPRLCVTAMGACAISLMLAAAGPSMLAQSKPRTPASANAQPAKLTYILKTGEKRHYKIDAFFSGHFPPFDSPNSPPVNLRAVLGYQMVVGKPDGKGMKVEFDVDSADLSLLEKDPGPGGMVDPDSVTPFPIPLGEVQKLFNTTAVLQPSGAMTGVSNSPDSPVKLALGFDLQKLCLLILPVVFPDHPVKPADSWTYDDGFLGHNPGKIAYTAQLTDSETHSSITRFNLVEKADAKVAGAIDKAGTPTTDTGKAAGTITGNVTVTGKGSFVARPAAGAAPPGSEAGRLTAGKLNLDIHLTRKRDKPDPDNPTAPLETKIDVLGRLSVTEDEPTPMAPKAVAARPAKASRNVRSAEEEKK